MSREPSDRFYAAARRVCRTRFPDLFFAAHFLPREQRRGAFIVAAVYDQLQRIIEAPDQGGGCCGGGCQGDDPRGHLAARVLDYLYGGEPTGKPELDGFAALAQQHQLKREYFQTALDALAQHAARKRYATWPSLYDHCRRAAGSLALLALQIFSPDADATAQAQAQSLAAAMRLTRMLARIGADGRAGRVMLPLDDLVRFKLRDSDVLQFSAAGHRVRDERIAGLLRFEIQRLEDLFTGGLKCLGAIDDPAGRRAVSVLANLHTRALDRIAVNKINVFGEPRRTNLWMRWRAAV